MKKTRWLALLMAVLMTVSLMGCGSSDQEVQDSTEGSDSTGSEDSSSESTGGASGISDAWDDGILRVGMECAYAPFNWTQGSSEVANGETAPLIYGTDSDYAYGYDVMVAQMIADELGMELEVHRVDWSSIVLGLNAGDYDMIIGGMAYTTERDAAVDFTDTYYIRDNVAIVRADSQYASATTLSELAGASVTTQIGTTWVNMLSQVPDSTEVTPSETTTQAVMNVANGVADVMITDEPTAMSAVAAYPELTYIVLDESDTFQNVEGETNNCCIAVREGSTELVDILNGALEAIEWDESKMAEYMDLAVELQPLNE